MTKDEIPIIARSHLSDLLSEAGSILYSSHETLKPNDIYLLGFNPGGTDGYPLSRSINNLLTNDHNAYLDECWENGNGKWNQGEAPLQKRICWLLNNIGQNPRDVCASNLIFLQSRCANDISYSLANRCWPVHEAIIEIVKPKVIMTFGNSSVSSYGYLHQMLGGSEEYIPSGHGNWNVKGFEASINGRQVYIAGLPHLSRYSPIGKEQILSWLKKRI